MSCILKYLSVLVLMLVFNINTSIAQNRSYNLNDSSASSLKAASISLSDNPTEFKNAQRVRELYVNPVFQTTGLVRVNDTIQLDLFNDKQYKAYIEKIDVDVNNTLTIRARLVDFTYGYCIISTAKGKSFITIDVADKGETYRSKYNHQYNKYYLMQIDETKEVELEGSPSLIPPEGNQPKNKVKKNGSPDIQNGEVINENQSVNEPDVVNSESTQDIVTLLIVYTPSAAAWSTTNETSINNTISLLMAKAQLALDNSNTLLTLQLVHSEQVTYTELNTSADLTNLTYTTDGYMDNIHTLRNTYSADVVVLLENITYTGGQGWLLGSTYGDPGYAFSLTRVQQASWTYTTIHEIGHNMGCHHHLAQTTQPGPGIFSYSAGSRWTGTGNAKYCSVMTYEQGTYFADGVSHTRVPYFSNPSIQYQGIPTGDAVTADNARTLRQTKSVVAAYRNPVVVDPNSFVCSAASQSQINLSWVMNVSNNPVLLAVNTSPVFGTPLNGTPYSAGNTIPGGGQVIYAGAATSFNHTSLQTGISYYYKLWSVASANSYSAGITASTSTPCSAISSFPWSEGFESGGSLPNCWTQEQVSNSGISWTFTAGNRGSNPANAHSGNYNALLKDENSGDNRTRLISPSIDLNLNTNPTLSFWHTQELWYSDQDILTVYYKTSAGGAWTQLATYTSSIPGWTRDSIPLPNKTSDYYICFEGNAKWGHGVCLDDVSITNLPIVPFGLALANKTVATGQDTCFNSTDTITVAGGENMVVFETGSTVYLIAGQSILFLPGFYAQEGSTMYASITTTGTFCNGAQGDVIVAQPSEMNTELETLTNTENLHHTEKMMKVYPNPNNGRFKVDLNDFEIGSVVCVYNSLGERVYQTVSLGSGECEINLPHAGRGIYFVRVSDGKGFRTGKIVVN